MFRRWPSKDPSAKKEYGFDYSDLFPDDPVVESTWTITGGDITQYNAAILDDYITIVFLQGGTVGDELTITNHVKLQSDREDDRSAILRIEHR